MNSTASIDAGDRIYVAARGGIFSLSTAGDLSPVMTGPSLNALDVAYDPSVGSTTVVVGGVACVVIDYWSTPSRLVCDMARPAWQEGAPMTGLPLALATADGETATVCCLSFSADATPGECGGVSELVGLV